MGEISRGPSVLFQVDRNEGDRQLTLRVGSKAYLDSFIGLVKCVVKDIREISKGCYDVQVLITSTSGYRKGETVCTSSTWVIPREAVYVRDGHYRILPYNTEV